MDPCKLRRSDEGSASESIAIDSEAEKEYKSEALDSTKERFDKHGQRH